MKISIVTTLYKSSQYIGEFYERVSKTAQKLAGDDYEIIFVNDGSPDDGIDIAVKLSQDDDHILVVDLSRNFGHHKALMTGLSYAKGELIYLLDSDLEEEPEWLLNFFEKLNENKCDVIYGVQEKRRGGWFEKWSGNLYFFVTSLMIDVKLPKNITTSRLMTKSYVDALLLHRESEIIISGLWQITGFDQRPHKVKKYSSTNSTYTTRDKFRLVIDTITSFSAKPLLYIFYVGLIIFLITVIYALFLFVNRILFNQIMDGWTSLMVSIWILGGIIISFIGIIGIYLSKIFSETKNRPYVIVKRTYKNEK
jgi:putative glycosyltransferase